MKIELVDQPVQTFARVDLEHGEALVAASGAMMAMTSKVALVQRPVGLVAGLKRLLSGSAFSPCELRAQEGPAEVLLAAPLPGDMMLLDVGPTRWMVSSGAFVASTGSVEVESRGGGLAAFYAGAGMFVLEASGAGRLLVGAFGALSALAVEGGAVVDTGHVVAWDASLGVKQHAPGPGLLTGWLSGESATCTFTGSGTVWIQSRNLSELGARVGARLPRRA